MSLASSSCLQWIGCTGTKWKKIQLDSLSGTGNYFVSVCQDSSWSMFLEKHDLRFCCFRFWFIDTILRHPFHFFVQRICIGFTENTEYTGNLSFINTHFETVRPTMIHGQCHIQYISYLLTIDGRKAAVFNEYFSKLKLYFLNMWW